METQLVKTYSNKSNAKRAIKALSESAALNVDEFVIPSNGAFIVDLDKVSKYEVEARANALARQHARKAKSKADAINTAAAKTIKPCKQVWHIADAMIGSSRKDVVKACVDAGINAFTARTQYQQWFTCHHNSSPK